VQELRSKVCAGKSIPGQLPRQLQTGPPPSGGSISSRDHDVVPVFVPNEDRAEIAVRGLAGASRHQAQCCSPVVGGKQGSGHDPDSPLVPCHSSRPRYGCRGSSKLAQHIAPASIAVLRDPHGWLPTWQTTPSVALPPAAARVTNSAKSVRRRFVGAGQRPWRLRGQGFRDARLSTPPLCSASSGWIAATTASPFATA